MRLKLLTPTEVLVDETVVKINAEGLEGQFCLLPRHRDWVAALVPGLAGFITPDGGETFVAVDVPSIVFGLFGVAFFVLWFLPGGDLAGLQWPGLGRFRHYDEQEKAARGAIARLEAGVIRRFLELQERAR